MSEIRTIEDVIRAGQAPAPQVGPSQQDVLNAILEAASSAYETLSPAAIDAYDKIQGFEFAVPGTDYTNQDLYDAISETKEGIREWAEGVKREEFAKEGDYNWFKDFMVETGADLAEVLPGGNLGVAFEGLDWGTGGITNLLPLLGLLPTGGVRKALLEATENEIKLARRLLGDAAEDASTRMVPAKELKGTIHAGDYALGGASYENVADDQMVELYLPTIRERLSKAEYAKAKLTAREPRVFETSIDPSSWGYGSGKALGQDFPVEELEDVLYHVTTEGKGLDIDPTLYGISSTQIEGLTGAGGAGSPGVSFLSEPHEAIRLLKELRRIKKAQNTVKSPEDFIQFLGRLMKEDTADYGASFANQGFEEGLRAYRHALTQNMEPDEAIATALARYRDRRGGDPLIFGSKLRDSDIELLAVPKENLPKGVRIDVHNDAAGREVRVHGDVPISRQESRELLKSLNLRRLQKPELDHAWEAVADPLAIESLNRAIEAGMPGSMVKLHKQLAVKSGRIFGLDKNSGYYEALSSFDYGLPSQKSIDAVGDLLRENPTMTLKQALDQMTYGESSFDDLFNISLPNPKTKKVKVVNQVTQQEYHIPVGAGKHDALTFSSLPKADQEKVVQHALDTKLDLGKSMKAVLKQDPDVPRGWKFGDSTVYPYKDVPDEVPILDTDVSDILDDLDNALKEAGMPEAPAYEIITPKTDKLFADPETGKDVVGTLNANQFFNSVPQGGKDLILKLLRTEEAIDNLDEAITVSQYMNPHIKELLDAWPGGEI